LRELAAAAEQFAGKLKRRAKVECGQTVDEQRIVSVVGLRNNWPQKAV